MGALPSHESHQRGLYSHRHGRNRRNEIMLIPLTKAFFPSADCPLFKHLAAARHQRTAKYYYRALRDADSERDSDYFCMTTAVADWDTFVNHCRESRMLFNRMRDPQEPKNDYHFQSFSDTLEGLYQVLVADHEHAMYATDKELRQAYRSQVATQQEVKQRMDRQRTARGPAEPSAAPAPPPPGFHSPSPAAAAAAAAAAASAAVAAATAAAPPTAAATTAVNDDAYLAGYAAAKRYEKGKHSHSYYQQVSVESREGGEPPLPANTAGASTTHNGCHPHPHASSNSSSGAAEGFRAARTHASTPPSMPHSVQTKHVTSPAAYYIHPIPCAIVSRCDPSKPPEGDPHYVAFQGTYVKVIGMFGVFPSTVGMRFKSRSATNLPPPPPSRQPRTFPPAGIHTAARSSEFHSPTTNSRDSASRFASSSQLNGSFRSVGGAVCGGGGPSRCSGNGSSVSTVLGGDLLGAGRRKVVSGTGGEHKRDSVETVEEEEMRTHGEGVDRFFSNFPVKEGATNADDYVDASYFVEQHMLKSAMFVDKDVGDQILGNVVMLAVHMYVRQCWQAGIVLRHLPAMPLLMRVPLSNIPMLQFIREFRIRLRSLLRAGTERSGELPSHVGISGYHPDDVMLSNHGFNTVQQKIHDDAYVWEEDIPAVTSLDQLFVQENGLPMSEDGTFLHQQPSPGGGGGGGGLRAHNVPGGPGLGGPMMTGSSGGSGGLVMSTSPPGLSSFSTSSYHHLFARQQHQSNSNPNPTSSPTMGTSPGVPGSFSAPTVSGSISSLPDALPVLMMSGFNVQTTPLRDPALNDPVPSPTFTSFIQPVPTTASHVCSAQLYTEVGQREMLQRRKNRFRMWVEDGHLHVWCSAGYVRRACLLLAQQINTTVDSDAVPEQREWRYVGLLRPGQTVPLPTTVLDVAIVAEDIPNMGLYQGDVLRCSTAAEVQALRPTTPFSSATANPSTSSLSAPPGSFWVRGSGGLDDSFFNVSNAFSPGQLSNNKAEKLHRSSNTPNTSTTSNNNSRSSISVQQQQQPAGQRDSTNPSNANNSKSNDGFSINRSEGTLNIEEVILSWMKGICANTRDEKESDPGWVRDPHGEPVRIDRYVIRRLEHDGVRYFIGVTPRFVGQQRRLERTSAAAAAAVLNNSNNIASINTNGSTQHPNGSGTSLLHHNSGSSANHQGGSSHPHGGDPFFGSLYSGGGASSGGVHSAAAAAAVSEMLYMAQEEEEQGSQELQFTSVHHAGSGGSGIGHSTPFDDAAVTEGWFL